MSHSLNAEMGVLIRDLLRIIPLGVAVGAAAELFMVKTGFYAIVTRKEGERRLERQMEREAYQAEREARRKARAAAAALANASDSNVINAD